MANKNVQLPDQTAVHNMSTCPNPLTSDPVAVSVGYVAPVFTLSKQANTPVFTYLGQVITYTYTITNNTDFKIVNVSIVDDLIPGACSGLTVAAHSNSQCTATYTITATDISNESNIVNTAHAQGVTESVPGVIGSIPISTPNASCTVNFQGNASLSLTKTANRSTYVNVGDEIRYTFTATNNGNVNVFYPSVTDDKIPFLECTEFVGIPYLRPGQTMVCIGVYVITQEDIDAGSVTNYAKVTGDSGDYGLPVADTYHTITAEQAPQIEITKSANYAYYSFETQVITYTYQVNNLGNVTVYNPYVVDLMVGLSPMTRVDPLSPDFVALRPGSFVRFQASYVVTATDIAGGAPIVNSATAYACRDNVSGMSVSSPKVIKAMSTVQPQKKQAGTIASIPVVTPQLKEVKVPFPPPPAKPKVTPLPVSVPVPFPTLPKEFKSSDRLKGVEAKTVITRPQNIFLRPKIMSVPASTFLKAKISCAVPSGVKPILAIPTSRFCKNY